MTRFLAAFLMLTACPRDQQQRMLDEWTERRDLELDDLLSQMETHRDE